MAYFSLFPYDHRLIKLNSLYFTTFTFHIIVLGKSVIKVADKCLSDTSTFLINAIVARICDVSYALFLFYSTSVRVHF